MSEKYSKQATDLATKIIGILFRAIPGLRGTITSEEIKEMLEDSNCFAYLDVEDDNEETDSNTEIAVLKES